MPTMITNRLAGPFEERPSQSLAGRTRGPDIVVAPRFDYSQFPWPTSSQKSVAARWFVALSELGRLIPKAGETPRRITGRSLNHTSIVLWVEAGPLAALLGADLEHTGVAGEGWMAVLHCHKSRHVPQPASLFKVPHHGSVNADYPDVWTHMLVPKPIAVVTPFNGGRKRLPQPSDLTRLGHRTDSLYCTSAGGGKALARDAVVEKTMRQQVKDRRVIEGKAGHVRVRWSLGAEEVKPIVETFNGAYRA